MIPVDLRALNEATKKCESPIERLLLPHLATMPLAFTDPDQTGCYLTDHPHVRLAVQPYVDTLAPFRPDFTVLVTLPGFQPVRLVIEADGHDFHEKTKEQAARDKARDRSFAGAGWVVARFTGSEIHESPRGVALQVADMLLNLIATQAHDAGVANSRSVA